MKTKSLTYLLLLIAALSIMLTSCDGDDSSYSQSIEGHWVYSETKADIHVTDTAILKVVEEYVMSRNSQYKVSYEFKNDKSYFYYKSHENAMKGIFKSIDKDYFIMDDLNGMKTVACQDTVIYVVSDLRKEIARELNIEEHKLVKVLATDTFRRGLFAE